MVHTAAYSPDGRSIVSGSRDGTVKIWDTASGKCVSTFEGHKSDVTSASYAPDGKYVVSGSRDSTVKIWDTASGKCVRTLEGHRGEVTAVAYAPDGKGIVSGGMDKTIKIWDVLMGKCLRTLEGLKNNVTCLDFAPGGKEIASGSEDNTINIWDASTAVFEVENKPRAAAAKAPENPQIKPPVAAKIDGTKEEVIKTRKDLTQALSDSMRTFLYLTKIFKVIDRTKMNEIMKEQNFQLTGCTTTECAVEIGKILNVKYMLIGSVSGVGREYVINIRITKVETSEIEVADIERCGSESELLSALKKLADRTALNKIFQKAAARETLAVLDLDVK